MEKQKMAAPDIKQVILVRDDLNMSPGKAAAQVGHAAILFMIDAVEKASFNNRDVRFNVSELRWMFDNGPIVKHGAVEEWTSYGGMKKIVLAVKDLTELHTLQFAAKSAGLKVFTVFDEGLNEITACAIGPDFSVAIDTITGDLPLYGPPVKPFKPEVGFGPEKKEPMSETTRYLNDLMSIVFDNNEHNRSHQKPSKAARKYMAKHGTLYGYQKPRQ